MNNKLIVLVSFFAVSLCAMQESDFQTGRDRYSFDQEAQIIFFPQVHYYYGMTKDSKVAYSQWVLAKLILDHPEFVPFFEGIHLFGCDMKGIKKKLNSLQKASHRDKMVKEIKASFKGEIPDFENLDSTQLSFLSCPGAPAVLIVLKKINEFHPAETEECNEIIEKIAQPLVSKEEVKINTKDNSSNQEIEMAPQMILLDEQHKLLFEQQKLLFEQQMAAFGNLNQMVETMGIMVKACRIENSIREHKHLVFSRRNEIAANEVKKYLYKNPNAKILIVYGADHNKLQELFEGYRFDTVKYNITEVPSEALCTIQ